MALPPLTPEQRRQHSRRPPRPDASGPRSRTGSSTPAPPWSDVIAEGRTNDVIGKMRVSALLESMPGVGKVRARQIMEELGISESRRRPRPGRQPGAAAPRARVRAASDPPTPAAPALTVLAGPTAVGKGTRRGRTCASQHPEVWISVSATTRRPRPGRGATASTTGSSPTSEFDGWSPTASSSSGPSCTGRPATARRGGPVEEALAAGRPALLEIDLQGARQVRETMPEALLRLPHAPVVGRAGPPARRPRHRDRGGARAPARDRAGRAGGRGRVRRDRRQRRRSRGGRGVGSLDGRPADPTT